MFINKEYQTNYHQVHKKTHNDRDRNRYYNNLEYFRNLRKLRHAEKKELKIQVIDHFVEFRWFWRRLDRIERRRQTILKLGLKHSKETRLAMSISHKGKPKSLDWKMKISESLKGRILSKKTRIKMAISRNQYLLKYNKKPHNFTKQTRVKMSESHKGKELTQLTKDKMRLSKMGRLNPMFGRNFTPIHRQGIREAMLKRRLPLKDNKLEKMFQLYLDLNKIKYETNKQIKGRPDVFIEPNICIFVDGDYFHGNPMFFKPDDVLKGGILAKDKWKYDMKITRYLTINGYYVLRIWEYDIRSNMKNIANNILDVIKTMQTGKLKRE